MAFMGADTEELREAGQECLDGKEKTDEVIQYLRALIIVLRAASFFTGGASAAYAEYLEATVVPWLEKVSQALGLMGKVLMMNAQAQDDASDGRTVDFAALPTYSTPGGAMPSTPVQPWEGTLVPGSGDVLVASPGTADVSGATPAAGGGAATVPGLGGLPDMGFGTALGDPALAGTGVTGTELGATGLGGTGLTATALGGTPFGDPTLGTSEVGTAGWGDAAQVGLGGGPLPGGTTGLPSGGDGAGSAAGGLPGGGSGGATTGGTELGATSVGDGDTGTLTSYSNDSVAGTGGPGELGSTSVDALGEPVAVADDTSYGAAAGIAAGAAVAGLGGAAVAARGRGNGDDRIEQLAAQNARGSRGDDVRELQQRLTDAGYDTRGVDGTWGANTQRAYEAYREANPVQVVHGSGYTSPSGFDYSQITGVRGNPNVTPEFLREVEGVAQRIGARPEHLMAVMSFETGGEFGADTRTRAEGGTAVGLIQFTPVAREQVGATREQLMAMTPVQQLEYVERYFEPRRGPQLSSVEGLYTSVLFGTGHTDPEHVLFRQGERGWEGNKGLDKAPRDGRITVAEAAARVRGALEGR